MPRSKHHSKKMSDSEWRTRKNKRRFYEQKEKKLAYLQRVMDMISKIRTTEKQPKVV
jgi:hypothetical protein